MLVLTFVCEFNQWQWIRNTLIVLTWNIQHTFFLCKIFDRESRKKETVGKEDNSRNSEAIEKQMGTIMGGCWVICVCVCGWSGDSAGAKKKKTKRLSKSEFVYYCCCFCYCKYSCGGVALDSRQFLSHCTYYAMYF